VQKVSHKRIFLALLAFMKLIYVHRLRGLRKGLKIRIFEDCKWPKQFIFPQETHITHTPGGFPFTISAPFQRGFY